MSQLDRSTKKTPIWRYVLLVPVFLAPFAVIVAAMMASSYPAIAISVIAVVIIPILYILARTVFSGHRSRKKAAELLGRCLACGQERVCTRYEYQFGEFVREHYIQIGAGSSTWHDYKILGSDSGLICSSCTLQRRIRERAQLVRHALAAGLSALILGLLVASAFLLDRWIGAGVVAGLAAMALALYCLMMLSCIHDVYSVSLDEKWAFTLRRNVHVAQFPGVELVGFSSDEIRRMVATRPRERVKTASDRIPEMRAGPIKDASAEERRESQIDKLRSLLAERQFREADLLTAEILCGGDTWTKVTVENVDALTLDTLDQLWSSASAGRFGFRVQCQLAATDEEVFEKARIPSWWSWESKRIYDLSAPSGHLPMAWLFGEPEGYEMGNDRCLRFFQFQHVRQKLF